MASAVLQLAIGIVLVFFLLGSVCSYLNELIAAVLDRRAAHLEAWIQKMLGPELAERFFLDPRIVSLRRPRAGQARRSSEGVPELADEQVKRQREAASARQRLQHVDRARPPSEPAGRAAETPAVTHRRQSRMAALRRPERRVPSYISSETFATALLAALERWRDAAPAGTGTQDRPRHDQPQGAPRGLLARMLRSLFPPRTVQAMVAPPSAFVTGDLATMLKAAPPSWPSHLLLALLEDAGDNDKAAFKQQLQKWFDQEMDRLSGWYKRRTKLFLLLYGAALAVILNVNAVLVAETLWNDPTVRSAVVAQAQQLTAPPPTTSGTAISGATSTGKGAAQTTAGEVGGATSSTACPPSLGGGPSDTTTTTADPLDCLANRVQTLQSLQLPIGWPDWPWPSRLSAMYHGDDPRFPHSPGAVVLWLFGLSVAALAAAQGGPFWFDLLGRLVDLRNTGPNPSQVGPAAQTATKGARDDRPR